MEIEKSLIESLRVKEAKLRESLRSVSPLIVAYSGGVDSTLLAYIAYQELGHNMLAILADSPSLAKNEKDNAISFLVRHNIPYQVVDTHEILDKKYVSNDKKRCYYCKTALFEACKTVALKRKWLNIAYGFNFDDSGDYRPGHQAALKFKVLSPLLDASFTKNDVRACSKQLHIQGSERPAQPCLASRLLYGTKVTVKNLSVVETVEEKLKQLGFEVSRARFDGTTLRIEVPINQIEKIVSSKIRDQLLRLTKELSVPFVALDLEGFASGKLNRTINT